jgi:predicted Zn-dependent protease
VLDEARIEELRRRVESDPASLAFAQLAEEFRRAGALQEAVRVCREGLTRHPGYISARVTLGRALFELGHDDEAQAELEAVLLTAPDNLIALRSIADIAQRRGDSGELEPAPDPVLAELESWLSAILNARASRATS